MIHLARQCCKIKQTKKARGETVNGPEMFKFPKFSFYDSFTVIISFQKDRVRSKLR